PEECGLSMVTGKCRGFFKRYYFNMASRECEPFIFGGCGGNENNFQTLAQCLKRCYIPAILPVVKY
ncbi:hypothetical protein LOTGIDRAFT_123062, partial [Lottia gigantea]